MKRSLLGARCVRSLSIVAASVAGSLCLTLVPGSSTAATNTAVPSQLVRTTLSPVAPAVAVKPRPASNVRVLSANVKEGAITYPGADRRDGRDRREFVRRAMSRAGEVPDVVLLQEARGSAGSFAALLSRHTQARRAGAQYVVAMRPRMVSRTGECDGGRAERYRSLRDSAILVNQATVDTIHARGVVRTWGRWNPWAATAVVGGAAGCAEHPWISATVRQDGRTPVRAFLLGAHVGPRNAGLKNAAISQLAAAFRDRMSTRPEERFVLGGDLNLNRCTTSLERRGCTLTPGHRALDRAGLVDAAGATEPDSALGPLGTRDRLDFVYTSGAIGGASFDRCYSGGQAVSPRCTTGQSVFPTVARLQACDRAATQSGHPTAGCPSRWYARYLSDHPMQHVRLR